MHIYLQQRPSKQITIFVRTKDARPQKEIIPVIHAIQNTTRKQTLWNTCGNIRGKNRSGVNSVGRVFDIRTI